MIEFKEGDKVRIKPDSNNKLAGAVGIIKKIYKNINTAQLSFDPPLKRGNSYFVGWVVRLSNLEHFSESGNPNDNKDWKDIWDSSAE